MKNLSIKLILVCLFINCIPLASKADTEPYIGEIQQYGANFCPRGWAPTNGQLLSIAQNTALFSIIGTIYGGDGRTTFALPDLRGRIILGMGTAPGLSTRRLGQKAGLESVTLNINEIPSHQHDYSFTVKEGRGVKTDATDSLLAESGIFRDNGNIKTLASQITNNTGSTQAHTNIQPYLVTTYRVALVGFIYPSRS